MTAALDNLRKLAEALPGPFMRFEVRNPDLERFVAELWRAGVRNVAFESGEAVRIDGEASPYVGVQIVTCNALPRNQAVLVGEDGKVLATWQMGESDADG